MRRIALMMILLALTASFMLGGCATLVETPEERHRRIMHITDLQMKMLVEDWDYFWLYERSSGMTQWHPWAGI